MSVSGPESLTSKCLSLTTLWILLVLMMMVFIVDGDVIIC